MTRRLGNEFEALEDRTLLAGNITATLVGDTLYVTGNNTDNYFGVYGNGSDGEVVVAAGNQETLTVVGGDSTGVNTGEFSGVTNIVIQGGRGNDNFYVYNIDIQGNLTLDGGVGSDDLFVFGGNANDEIGIGGAATLNGGAGNDNIHISGGLGNDTLSVGLVTLNGISGDDSLRVNDLSVATNVTLVGGAGDDALELERSTIGGTATILGQAGSDLICAEYNQILGDLLVTGGASNDSAYDYSNLVGGFSLWGGIENFLSHCPIPD